MLLDRMTAESIFIANIAGPLPAAGISGRHRRYAGLVRLDDALIDQHQRHACITGLRKNTRTLYTLKRAPCSLWSDNKQLLSGIQPYTNIIMLKQWKQSSSLIAVTRLQLIRYPHQLPK